MYFDFAQYKQKGQVLIFIILALVVAGFLGVMFYAGKITPKPPVTSTASPSATTDASPAPTGAGETANWKTYTGSYSSFDIPKELVKKGSIPPPKILESIDLQDPNFKYTIHYQVSTYLVNPGPNYKEIILDGQPAVKYTVIAGQAANIYQPTILLSYKNRWYLIDVSISDNPENQALADKILDQIVSSFKLLK